MGSPDLTSMGELEFMSWLHWMLSHDGQEPRHVVVYPFDLAIDIVLPVEKVGPVQVAGDEW